MIFNLFKSKEDKQQQKIRYFFTKTMNSKLEKYIVDYLNEYQTKPSSLFILHHLLRENKKGKKIYDSCSKKEKRNIKLKMDHFINKCNDRYITVNTFFYDLKSIQIEHVKSYFKKKLIVKNIKYPKDIFRYKRDYTIGYGSFGFIVKYTLTSCSKNKICWIHPDLHSVAIKFDTGRFDESLVSNAVRYKKDKCGIIPLRRIYKFVSSKDMIQPRFVHVLKLMDCNLLTWLRSEEVRFGHVLDQIPMILKSLKKQLICLLYTHEKFIYTDLKPTNIGIIYDKEDNSIIKELRILDLGSVNGLYSYPCCKPNKDFRIELKSINQKKKCIQNQLLFLFYFIIVMFYPKQTQLKKIMKEDIHNPSYINGKKVSHFLKKNIKPLFKKHELHPSFFEFKPI